MVSVTGLWLAWDSLPLLAILVTHYKNFSSFSNEAILFTEYTVDDPTSDWVFDDDEQNSSMSSLSDEEETSGIIKLDEELGSSSSNENDEIKPPNKKKKPILPILSSQKARKSPKFPII